MKKNDAFSYDVKHGEKITIKVTAVNFLDSLVSVRAVLDDEILHKKPDTEDAPIFEFTVTKFEDDIHTLMMEFTFVVGTPNNSKYVVSISGQHDQGCPCGFTIEKDNADKSPDIEFIVVS